MRSISSSVVSTSPFQNCLLPNRSREVRFRISYSSNKDMPDSNGRLVDENMIVLRTRIHDVKVAEKEYVAPANWMVWEKEYLLETYGADVCEFVGIIQTLLLNTRPSVAVGTVFMVAMALPMSAILVSLHLMEMAKGLMHLG